ncbi:hypothetical protein Tco_1061866 [Tanacetum coccineum]
MCHNLLSIDDNIALVKLSYIQEIIQHLSTGSTPPHDVIKEMAENIVTTMAAHKNKTSSNPVTAKRSILPQLSSEANKKKGE